MWFTLAVEITTLSCGDVISLSGFIALKKIQVISPVGRFHSAVLTKRFAFWSRPFPGWPIIEKLFVLPSLHCSKGTERNSMPLPCCSHKSWYGAEQISGQCLDFLKLYFYRFSHRLCLEGNLGSPFCTETNSKTIKEITSILSSGNCKWTMEMWFMSHCCRGSSILYLH